MIFLPSLALTNVYIREHPHLTSDDFGPFLTYLFSKIRWSLTYLPTLKSDVICGCSHSICNGKSKNLIYRSKIVNLTSFKNWEVYFPSQVIGSIEKF